LDSRIIIDSTVFYAGIPFVSLEKYYTTNQIIEELYKITFFKNRIETLVSSNRLVVTSPSSSSFESISKATLLIENKSSLSVADISIIALAKDFLIQGWNGIILTDDFAIQNVAKNQNIPYRPLLYSGIKHSGKWISFCSGCNKSYIKTEKICIICGNPLKRKLNKD